MTTGNGVHRCPHSREGLPPVLAISPMAPHLQSRNQNPLMRFGAPTQGWLVCFSGLHAGEDFRIANGTLTLGTSMYAAISLTCPSVSLRHAEIFCNGAHLAIANRKSRHGVSVNRNRVDEAILSDLDLISIGKIEFLLRTIHADAPKDKRESVMRWARQYVPVMQKRIWTVGWLVSHSDNGLPMDMRLFYGANHIGLLPNRERIVVQDAAAEAVCEIRAELGEATLHRPTQDVQVDDAPATDGTPLRDGQWLTLGPRRYQLRLL